METEMESINQATKKLRRLQHKQARAVKRISRWRSQEEHSTRKLRIIEARIAALAGQTHQSLGQGAQSPGPSARGLRPACLIINPQSAQLAQKTESPESLVARLRAHGIQPEVHLKTSGRDVRHWVRAAVRRHASLFIAAGGDGTVEDVGLSLVGSHATLGILPVGTMNNLARSLGIPLDLDQACALLGAGSIRQIDIGSLRNSADSEVNYFLETAGVGLSIALPAGQNIKRGRWGRIPEALRKMFDLGTEPITIELDDGVTIETKVKLVTVSNAPLFALNNLVAPDAKMDDGLFDVGVYDGLSDLGLAGYFVKVSKAQRVVDPHVRFHRAAHAHIRSRTSVPASADKNELTGCDELDFEVIPRALSVIVGQGMGLTWPVDAVPSVPPLTGTQKVEAQTEGDVPPNGAEHGVLDAMSSQPEPSAARTN